MYGRKRFFARSRRRFRTLCSSASLYLSLIKNKEMAFTGTNSSRDFRLLPVLNGAESGSADVRQVFDGAPYVFMYPASYSQNEISREAFDSANKQAGTNIKFLSDDASNNKAVQSLMAADVMIATDDGNSMSNITRSDMNKIAARDSMLDVMKRVAIVMRTGHFVYTQEAVERYFMQTLFSVASRSLDDMAAEAVARAIKMLEEKKTQVVEAIAALAEQSRRSEAGGDRKEDPTKKETAAAAAAPFVKAVELTESVAGILLVDQGIGLGDAFRNYAGNSQMSDRFLLIPFALLGGGFSGDANETAVVGSPTFNVAVFALSDAVTSPSARWTYQMVHTDVKYGSSASLLNKKDAQWIMLHYTRYGKPSVTLQEFVTSLSTLGPSADLYSLAKAFAQKNESSYVLLMRNPVA